MAIQYADEADARSQAVEGLKAVEQGGLNSLLEAASRIFELAAEVPTDYFAPAPAVPTWTAATAFQIGARIVPSIRNARIYEATAVQDTGETGDAEPIWPVETDATVQDGGILWTDRGFEGTIRTFYGDGTDYLFLPPYVSGSLGAVILPPEIPGIEFREVNGGLQRTAPGVGVSLSLLDAASWNQSLYVTPGRRPWDGWPYGVPIQVVARWGFLSVPGDVRQATIQIAVKLHRETDPAFVKVQEIDGQVIREALPPTAERIAKKYRDRHILFDSF